MKVMYLLDGDDNEELQKARQNVREVEGKTSGKGKEIVLDETKSESSRKQFEAKVPEEVDGEGLNDNASRAKDRNETEYFDSNDHWGILGSEDDENTDVYRRRSRFPTYNPNLASPHFCIGMLFKDGKQFKSVIRKYSMCCRRELKIIMNEPNRVELNALHQKKCKRRIFASCSNMARCIQNKMVNEKVITEHFEATIGDHLKMKLREIQRKVASEMHVNVNMKRVEHRNYARHVLSNWSSRKKAKTFEFAFWKVMKSTTENEWEQNKEDLYKLDEGVAKELFPKNSKAWTKAFQGLHLISDILDNNLCKAFNSNIVESRSKSIITILEEIRVNIITRIVAKRKQCSSWKYNYGPLTKKKIDDSKKEGNGENGCEVKKGRKQYVPKPLSRDGLIMRCRKYGGEGHNKGSYIQPNTTKAQSGTSTRTRSPKNNNITPCIQPNTTESQFGTSTQTRCQKKNNRTPCTQPNTIGSQSGTSMRTASQKRMAYQEPISTQESTAAKKMKK
ncbi:hypothetical protein CXB51_028232 [Gossypium anomalum]|uniref:Uncharacterized protein n=1 Tax=Gossypium anomalum TaxID=47600 RepID=A0A8J5YGU5_9ROSI|nr:hypothetical protein CXB51_028232 [Gossypium anomalum]